MSTIPTGSASYQKRNPHMFPKHSLECKYTDADIERVFCGSKPVTREADLHEEIATSLLLGKSSDESKLNKTEAAYLAHLRTLQLPYIGIQNIALKLADDCRLTPDFNYINNFGKLVFIDVKGFQREDAFIKMKFAARAFRFAIFLIIKRDGKSWDVKEVKP